MTNQESRTPESNSGESALQGLEGRYVGISPTDESVTGFGEIEVVIGNHWITSRCATGLDIEEDCDVVASVVELPDEAQELAQDMPRGATLRVFGLGIDDERRFNFVETPEGRQLCVTGTMGDLLGPTVLFGPEQVARHKHEELMAAAAKTIGGSVDMIPRLDYGGMTMADWERELGI